ncbi:MAG: hypothetical protein U0869_15820 [Chloroflexota bacterium]
MRRWILVSVAVVVGLVLVGGWWLLNLEPVAFGYEWGRDAHLFLGEQEAQFPDDDDVITFRWQPGEHFAVLVSLRNDAPVPITLLGTGPGLRSGMGGFALDDLAPGRSPGPNDPETDPWTQPALSPTTLEPGAQVTVWARFKISKYCKGQVPWEPVPDWPEGGSSGMSTESIPVSYQVLGITRSMFVPLPFTVQMVNGGPDAITECPVKA